MANRSKGPAQIRLAKKQSQIEPKLTRRKVLTDRPVRLDNNLPS